MEESWAPAQGLEREGQGVGEGSGRVTHRHVRPCSNEGVGHGVDELATHTKVAQFDLAARVHQDVGGLNVCRDQRERDHVRQRARVQIQAAPIGFPSPFKCPFSSTPSKNISQDALHTAKLAPTTPSQQKGQTCKPLSTSLLLNTGQEEQNNSADMQRFHTWRGPPSALAPTGCGQRGESWRRKRREGVAGCGCHVITSERL